jgi:hypothetical protein
MRWMSCVATGFKMDRRMKRRYRHRFIRHIRVWLQYGSRLRTYASDDPTPWPSIHPTVGFKSYRDAPSQMLQHRMNRRLDRYTQRFIRRSNSNHAVPPRAWSLQHRMIRRGVGVLRRCIVWVSWFKWLYWSLWVTRWSDALQGETIGLSDGTTFSRNLF